MLVRLFSPEKVHLREAAIARIGDDGRQQHRRCVSPDRVCQPGALVEAHSSCYLERHHAGDDDLLGGELVDRHLIGLGSEPTAGGETLEIGEEIRPRSPLGSMELAQRVERADGSGPSVRPMGGALRREVFGGSLHLSTECRRQSRQVRLRIGEKWTPWRDREWFSANAAREDLDQAGMGGNPLEVHDAGAGVVQPGLDERDGGFLFSPSDEEVHVIRAKPPAAHDPETLQSQPVRLLQGETSEEAITIHDQHEDGSGPTGADEPPRPHEGRGGG